jgi:SAM-dependent methyltransferase
VAFLSSVRRRGLMTTLDLVASEYAFDARFGTSTHGVLEAEQLGMPAAGVDHRGLVYHAINPRIFSHSMAMIPGSAQRGLREGSFVDFGCGKGRALILAAQHGFSKVVGVECSPLLHGQCIGNLRRARERGRFASQFEAHLGDAAGFPVPDDSTVWFWFNPFDEPVARRVAGNMIDSLLRRPRNAYLVYANPRLRLLMEALGFDTVAELRGSGRPPDAILMVRPS